jgi:hypothetical protein
MIKTIFGALLIIPFIAFGQTANPVIITWQANNYFPADYGGRAAATLNSPVIASVELIQKGKLADITGADIRWYVDGSQIANGPGLKTASFAIAQNASGYQNVRVSVGIGAASFENSVRIPIVKPAITVVSPLLGGSVKAGEQVDLQAIPFFFNVDSLKKLSFVWHVNNQTVAGNENKMSLKIGTPQSDYESSVLVSVTAQNSGNPYEFNAGSLNLSIIK